MTEPEIGLLTLVACAHTEGLGSIEAVAKEKGALFEAIGAQGTCIANADDPLVMSQLKRSKARAITFGTASNADVRAVETTSRGFDGQTVHIAAKVAGSMQQLQFTVPLLGAAGVYASAAATGRGVGNVRRYGGPTSSGRSVGDECEPNLDACVLDRSSADP